MPIQIPIQRIGSHSKKIPLPAYMTDHASGMDLFAACENEMSFKPGERILVPTGFAIAIPPGYEAQIRPRSGLALKQGITCLNTPGTIDADYRGEIKVLLINLGQEPALIRRGDRIAQMIIQKVEKISWQETDSLPPSPRGNNGFGSTDIK